MLPVFYSNPFLATFDAFALFVERLLKAESKWDKYVYGSKDQQDVC
jgi:hypothetical protein